MSSQYSSRTILISGSILLLGITQIAQWASKSVNFSNRPSQTNSSLVPSSYICSNEGYTVEVLSFDPWVMYANNFIKEEEINHLIEVVKDDWYHSHVYHKQDDDDSDFVSEVNKDYRTSWSAVVSQKDVVSKCLLNRVRSLMGNLQHEDLEPLQLVKYEGGERFRLHQDWHEPSQDDVYDPADPTTRPHNRLMTSFFYLEDNCTGGETYFPDLSGVTADADGDKFSRTESGQGLLVKPKRGSAMFWMNIFMNGTGDPRLLHASLPVKSGRKIGMNLFSLYYFELPIAGAWPPPSVD